MIAASRTRRLAAYAIASASIVWLGLLVASPLDATRTHGTAASTASWLTYAAGRLVCHQRPERSFALAGRQMPVCARCFGLYASAALGLIAACAAPVGRAGRSRPIAWLDRHARELLLAGALPTAASAGLELLVGFDGSNVGRALAAIPTGAAVGWVVARAVVGALDPRPGVAVGIG